MCDSDTDFEEELTLLKETAVAESKSIWESELRTLLSFSEDILPSVFRNPMEWCRISIQQSLKHIAKMEEILKDGKIRRLGMQLGHKEALGSTKPYSLSLFKYAADLFYFAFHQNPVYSPELRVDLDICFEVQFGRARLDRARTLLKLYLRQFSQLNDFFKFSVTELFSNERLANFIIAYLTPTNDKSILQEKINELIKSSDYQEKQVALLLLTKENCGFKEIILQAIYNYVITESNNSTSFNISDSTSPFKTKVPSRKTRSRLQLFVNVDANLLVTACQATESFSTSLFSIITEGLDIISKEVTENRSKIFHLFRQPLFDGNDRATSLPRQYLSFYAKYNEIFCTIQLLKRVKSALERNRKEDSNTKFWIELFRILNSLE